ncbi:hypothetical protein F0562_004465 [Nyssa sinensis]|uniref:BRO1 domain-containing protein n=1 Tax=Nyssa sinensis TaxID=561372 RepID=A0A5J5C057_9ASTE|nr:hypothetical protein F0562_004465 [Nyssa sinensis]
MGCTSSISIYTVGKKKKKNIAEVAVFVPSIRLPVQSDLQKTVRGLVPKDLANRISSLRNQIVLVAEDTVFAGGSAVTELQRALEEYLPLLLGLTNTEIGLQDLIEFKWKQLEDGKQEDHSGSCERIVSSDCIRDAVDLLLNASGYLEFCVRDVLVQLPDDVKKRLPKDLHEGVLEAISFQALGQGTEMQLSLAVESQNATLSVKRRLACEQMSYFGQAHYCLSGCNIDHGYGKKHLLFIKWKYLEAKAAAYYYHGLILDKGTEPSCHISAVCCFLAAEELLSECKKVCLSFCLAVPVTRAPPPWGAIKNLNKKIPEVACRKSQMYGYLLDQEKGLQILPDLPEFQLSLRPDDY